MSAADRGTYACFAREITYWSGPSAGRRDLLEDGEVEYDVITPKNLLWQYESGESVHNGLALRIVLRPAGRPELVACTEDESFTIRIALDQAPMPFTALGSAAIMRGICHFTPEAQA